MRAGAGVALLPCYLAHDDPSLHALGPVVDEVSAEQWLLVHRDLGDLPRIRAVIDAVTDLFRVEHATLDPRQSQKLNST